MLIFAKTFIGRLCGLSFELCNAALSFHRLVKNADEHFLLDYEAWYDTGVWALKLTTPTHGDLSHWVSMALNGVTAGLHLPGLVFLRNGLCTLDFTHSSTMH